jgi:predicted cupin superfamily sugar epimerase
MLTASEIIRSLNLKPHPIEGGFFRETYRSMSLVPALALPPSYGGTTGRSFGTAIYYLLTPQTFSELHRLPTEEVFHFYLGSPVRMLQLFEDGRAREVVLGTDIRAGQEPQVTVPAGVWQGSRLEPFGEHDFALLGATMAPGFDYADYVSGERAGLIEQYPAHADLIRLLMRQ